MRHRGPSHLRHVLPVAAALLLLADIAFAQQRPGDADSPGEIQIREALRMKGLPRCPQSQCAATGPGIAFVLAFASGSTALDAAAVSEFSAHASALREFPHGQALLVRGHADAKGSDTDNQALSERRAAAVKQYLVKTFGIPAENVIAVGLGSQELKNGGDPRAAENRRVEVMNARPVAEDGSR